MIRLARMCCLAAMTLVSATMARAQAPDSAAAVRVAPMHVGTRSDTLARAVVPIAGVEVSTTRGAGRLPIASSTLSRAELERRNIGLDTPMHLATLPGVYVASDAGNGIGYSYLSIRGFPQRRISVQINGVPLNDPQSHEVYWIDHPDLLASTAEVQVQRGVGSALYGAASVGGSVNIETSPFTHGRDLRLALGAGSFGTRRATAEMNSGDLSGGWNVYGRYSRIESDGYRDQSDTRLWSYFFSARHVTATQAFRANLYGGPEETHLAYLGVPQAYLDGAVSGDRDRDRRFNPLVYDGERDHFFEPHYELIHTWTPKPDVALTQTLFYFDGDGYYDEQRLARSLADYRLPSWSVADSTLLPRDYYRQDPSGALSTDSTGRYIVDRTDLVRRRSVINRHYGWVPRVRLGTDAGSLTLGGELRFADGHHVGQVVSGSALPPGTPPDTRYYDYHPRTLAAGLFMRASWSPRAHLNATADLAWRHQSYAMRDDQFDGIQFDQHYDFALPRLGLEWTTPSGMAVYGSYAYSSREPALRDLYDAEGVGSLPLYGTVDVANGIYENPLIHPEHVNDLEVGARWTHGSSSATVDAFHMDFRDELVYAGQFDVDLGYPVVGNAARSVHQGIELAARTEMPLGQRPRDREHRRGAALTIDANATLSDNHFVSYQEVYGTAVGDTVHYDGNTIGFFPETMANLALRADIGSSAIGLEAQYIGRIFVDNTATDANSIAPHSVLNLMGSHRRAIPGAAWADLSVRVLNLLDNHYETSGYMDYDASGSLVPQLIPAATRGWQAQLTLGF